MKIHGNCFCKAIRYEADIDTKAVIVCHCKDCQVLSGTAYRVSVAVAAENFQILQGAPKLFYKTAESGNRRAQAFCETCGTPLYAATASVDGKAPREYKLRLGAIQERATLTPQKEIWCRSALPWSRQLQTAERVEKQG